MNLISEHSEHSEQLLPEYFSLQSDVVPHLVGKPYNPKKARGNYPRTAKNKNPSYTVPESHISSLPFIQDLVKQSYSRDVTGSDSVLYARAVDGQKKRLYRDGANSVRALVSVFSEHLNVVTHQVKISLRNASDAAGLSTTSNAEKEKQAADPTYKPVVSISRTSRGLRKMIRWGWIIAPDHWQVWDKERGHWIDKYFEVTELFFDALGITRERMEKQRDNRLKYLRDQAIAGGLTPEQAGRMSIASIKHEQRTAWRRAAFDRRKKEQQRKKTQRTLDGKKRTEQRNVAAVNIVKALGSDIVNFDYQEFKDMTNKEVATLRKFANIAVPDH